MVFVEHIGKTRQSGKFKPAERRSSLNLPIQVAFTLIQVHAEHGTEFEFKIAVSSNGQTGEAPAQQHRHFHITQIQHIFLRDIGGLFWRNIGMTPFHREIDLRLQFQIALIIQGVVGIQTRIGAQFVEPDQVIAGNLGGGETDSHTALEIAGSGGASFFGNEFLNFTNYVHN